LKLCPQVSEVLSKATPTRLLQSHDMDLQRLLADNQQLAARMQHLEQLLGIQASKQGGLQDTDMVLDAMSSFQR
jgi:hypothetical protein